MAIRILIVTLCLGIAGVYARDLASSRVTVTARPNLQALPSDIDGWHSENFALSDRVADVLDADLTLQRCYRNKNGAEVWLFLAYFAQQQVNSQIHSPRHCVPGSGWNVVSLESRPVQLEQGQTTVACMNLEFKGTVQEMAYWFLTRSGTVTGEYALKWDLLRNALARRPTDALFVRYYSPQKDVANMYQLMQELDPSLSAIMREVGFQ